MTPLYDAIPMFVRNDIEEYIEGDTELKYTFMASPDAVALILIRRGMQNGRLRMADTGNVVNAGNIVPPQLPASATTLTTPNPPPTPVKPKFDRSKKYGFWLDMTPGVNCDGKMMESREEAEKKQAPLQGTWELMKDHDESWELYHRRYQVNSEGGTEERWTWAWWTKYIDVLEDFNKKVQANEVTLPTNWRWESLKSVDRGWALHYGGR